MPRLHHHSVHDSTEPPELNAAVPHLVEFILATAIRCIPRPIVLASAAYISAYLNVASRIYTGLGPTHAAIYRMPWIDSGLAARLGNLWLFQELDKISASSGRYYRPLHAMSEDVPRFAGASGNLELVQYYLQTRCPFGLNVPGILIEQASIHGHVHVLDWLAEHFPKAFESVYSSGHFGTLDVRVLKWWIAHQDLWVPAWEGTRHDWQLWVLVNACREKRMDVVKFWLGAQDYTQIDIADPGRLSEYLAWPLAATAYTGDLDVFAKVHAMWPEAMNGTVLAFACGSGNLELAKYCHSLLFASESQVIDKQGMDLSYLLVTAAGDRNGDQFAITILNWLHDDLQFPVAGHYSVTGSPLWFRRILPATWPGSWDTNVTRHYCMEVATRLASTPLLNWWHVHAKAVRGPLLTFFDMPLLAAVVHIRQVDPTPVLQWWIESGLIPTLDKYPARHVQNLIRLAIEDGRWIEVLDWVLVQAALAAERRRGGSNGGGCGDDENLFPIRLMTLACRAGRVDVLKWIVKNEDKLPAPVFAGTAFDSAYRKGHLEVLQWLVDRGFLDKLRAMDIERGGDGVVHVQSVISFIPEKWPECFECLAWSLANGFQMSKTMRKRVEGMIGNGSGNVLYSFLIQRKRPWGA